MKIQDLVRDDILETPGYVSGEQPASGKFIKLNTNENPFPPSTKVIAALHEAVTQGLNVYPDASAKAFRISAAGLLGLQPENLICGNGSDDILTILTRTFVSAGSKIRIPYPSYVLYKTLAAIQGARTEEFKFEKDWSISSDFGKQDDDLKLVFLPNPNSPSGTVIDRDTLIEIASSLECPLVLDEAYADFAKSHAVDLVSRCENIIVTRTLSKSYALAGLRFGFAIAHPSIIEQLEKVKDSYNCDAISIAGATAAINDQSWLAENTEKIVNLRNDLWKELIRLGFEAVPSEANFIWCRHAGHSSKSLYEQLKQNHILVRYMDYPDWGDGLRVSVGTASQISALVTILESIIGG
ncbi:MAG: histidinol-phosphate transaminase [Planctomycetota bacterium]|nr:histidinol-phosphate transaminase [Planctomycetota bacterium]